jgi:putative intracellular protease/amidase
MEDFMQPIVIVLSDRYSDWEIATLAGAGRAFFEADVSFATPSGGDVTSVAGLHISQTDAFRAPAEGVVVVCGGPAWEGEDAPDIGEALIAARDRGCVIAGICGGTVALARAGLLDAVRHTSNAPDYLTRLVPGYAGAAHYVDQPQALRDGNIITAPAPAPASFATEVLIAAGLEAQAARQIQDLLAAEHRR